MTILLFKLKKKRPFSYYPFSFLFFMQKFFLYQAKSGNLQGKFSDFDKQNKQLVFNVHFDNSYSLVAFKFLKT